jgi:hypothetical protein
LRFCFVFVVAKVEFFALADKFPIWRGYRK